LATDSHRINLRSFERERPGWLARWRLRRSVGGRYVDHTGQGIDGQPARPSPIDQLPAINSVHASGSTADVGRALEGPMPKAAKRAWTVHLRRRLLGSPT
jgi:hypothetical protein